MVENNVGRPFYPISVNYVGRPFYPIPVVGTKPLKQANRIFWRGTYFGTPHPKYVGANWILWVGVSMSGERIYLDIFFST